MNDLIRREDVIEGLYNINPSEDMLFIDAIVDMVENLPSIELNQTGWRNPDKFPNNQLHLCDSCMYIYPECPADKDDVIFGNSKGHDNICACAKFEIKPERTGKVEYIAEVYRGEIVDHYLSGMCGICGEYVYDHAKYCSDCGAKLDWE